MPWDYGYFRLLHDDFTAERASLRRELLATLSQLKPDVRLAADETLTKLETLRDRELIVLHAISGLNKPIPKDFDQSLPAEIFCTLLEAVRSARQRRGALVDKRIDRCLTIVGFLITSALVVFGWYMKP